MSRDLADERFRFLDMPISFQERIAVILSDHPQTLQELATIAGVTKGLVGQWKNGPAKSMSFAAAQRINRKYGYALNWLMKGEPPERDGSGSNTGSVTTIEQDNLLKIFDRLASHQRAEYMAKMAADADKNESIIAELTPKASMRKKRMATGQGEAYRVRVGGAKPSGSTVRKRRGT